MTTARPKSPSSPSFDNMKDFWENIKFWLALALMVALMLAIIAFALFSVVAKIHFALKFW